LPPVARPGRARPHPLDIPPDLEPPAGAHERAAGMAAIPAIDVA